MKIGSEGWTLLQLMIGIAVLGILLSLAMPRHAEYKERVKIAQAIQDIGMIGLVLDDLNMDQGQLPQSLNDIGMGGLVDPWGKPYQYVNIQNQQGNGKLRKDRNLVPINSDYDLYSMGPDGKSQSPLTAKASHDDIIRANNGLYIGIASEY